MNESIVPNINNNELDTISSSLLLILGTSLIILPYDK